jgi:hypothetical protein
MNLKAILAGEEQKWRRRHKALSANEKHRFYYLREFIQFCLKAGVDDTEKIDNKVYSNYVRYLKHAKNNNERTRLDKCYVVKKFLEENNCLFIPNPWRAYARKDKNRN